MPSLLVNGVHLYHEERGAGTPILCIHGTGSSSELWTDAATRLATRRRAIIYDRRGFSRSERPRPLVLTVEQHGDDAAALLDALGATPAIVIGRSQGGEVAVDLALRHPEHVRALVLLEGGGLALSDALVAWIASIGHDLFAAAERDIESVGDTMLRAVLGEQALEELPDQIRRVFAANGPAIVAEERGGLLDTDRTRLAQITAPTLVLSAADSPRPLAEAMELVAATIPTARLKRIEGGHLISPAHPGVLRFIDGLATA